MGDIQLKEDKVLTTEIICKMLENSTQEYFVADREEFVENVAKAYKTIIETVKNS